MKYVVTVLQKALKTAIKEKEMVHQGHVVHQHVHLNHSALHVLTLTTILVQMQVVVDSVYFVIRTIFSTHFHNHVIPVQLVHLVWENV